MHWSNRFPRIYGSIEFLRLLAIVFIYFPGYAAETWAEDFRKKRVKYYE